MTNLRIIAKKPGVVDYEEYELPPLGPRDILVKTKFSAVSHATELALRGLIPSCVCRQIPSRTRSCRSSPQKEIL